MPGIIARVDAASPSIPFRNPYAAMPDRFYARVAPTPVRAPRLLALNHPLARDLGLDPVALATDEGVALLAGTRVAAGTEPIALAYAGHQFGHFVPSLGDGRAVLLGALDGADGRARDVQLKGSGPTPFSRHADGRAALGPVIREYIVSEAMAALGVPTTRALAALATGEDVLRETVLPGAVLVRVASSHLRVGSFEYFAARRDTEALRLLVDHALARHPPEDAADAAPARVLLDAVIARQAALVAHWMALGFVHGVMNTDNTAISGETIDYGPCAFLDAYDPGQVFSAIDAGGRYAFANQPRIALWNLARLAEALLPVLDAREDAAIAIAEDALAAFGPAFEGHRARHGRAKLGLRAEEEGDGALLSDLLARMAAGGVDHTRAFRLLCDAAAAEPAAAARADAALGAMFADPGAWEGWAAAWRARIGREGGSDEGRAAAMRRANPAIIPRNHRVEEAIAAAMGAGDLGPLHAMAAAVANPFEDRPEHARYTLPPEPAERVLRTFCGT